MEVKDLEAVEKIKRATRELLDEQDVRSITVRQIAARAGVGVGLINYHFGSKNELLGAVIGERMNKMAVELLEKHEGSVDPRQRLSDTIKALFSFGAEYKPLMQMLIRQGFDSGENTAILMIVPILRQILGEDADEMRLRLIAMQILHPIQVMSLAPELYHVFCGIDIDNESQRDALVDSLIANLI